MLENRLVLLQLLRQLLLILCLSLLETNSLLIFNYFWDSNNLLTSHCIFFNTFPFQTPIRPTFLSVISLMPLSSFITFGLINSKRTIEVILYSSIYNDPVLRFRSLWYQRSHFAVWMKKVETAPMLRSFINKW